jgi:ActR/RegA family two-component response regulator
MTRQHNELKVLICEDEYLLAIDLASQLGERGVTVAGVMARVSDVREAMQQQAFDANAAVLDVQLLDGSASDLVMPMLARGMTVVLCSGYGARDLPPELAGLPSVGKPTDIDELLAALGGTGSTAGRWRPEGVR